MIKVLSLQQKTRLSLTTASFLIEISEILCYPYLVAFQRRKALSANTGGHAPLGQAPGVVDFFTSPDANAKGGMFYDAERSPAAARRYRRCSLCDVPDHMDDFQQQKEMTASAQPKQAVISFLTN